MPDAATVLGVKVNHNLPAIPRVMADLMDSQRFYVFNVGPKQFDIPHSAGRFIIPPCPEGADYSEAVKFMGKPGIPAIVPQTIVANVDGTRVQHDWDFKLTGQEVIKDLLGFGENDRRKYGVFLAAGPVPTQAEIDKAIEHLHAYYDTLVAQADKAYEINGGQEIGDDGRSHSAIGPDHVLALKALGLDRPWARKNAKMVACEGCGQPVNPNAVRCPHTGCGAILNEEKARKLFPHLFQTAEEKRGPGRPRKEEVA